MNDEGRLDPDMASLLREAGQDVQAPPGAEARVMARLATTFPALGGGGGPGPGGTGGPAAPGTVVSGASTLARAAPWLATLVVGGAIGAAGMHFATTRTSERVTVSPKAPQATEAAPPPSAAPTTPSFSIESLPSADPVRVPSARPSAAPVASEPSPRVEPAGDLVAERRLIDAARSSLARGDHASALAALATHERDHAAGKLAPEREALYVRALADAGQKDAARARAAHFRATWPTSMLLPAVEAATPR